MKNLTAILVDDIPAALQLLASDIQQKHASISIIGQAKSVVEAAKLLQKEEPDILFLDINGIITVDFAVPIYHRYNASNE